MAEKFVVFDDAAKELRMAADELKKLTEEGKIRPFMDSGKIKFRQKDIDDLKASLGIGQEEHELSLAPPDEAASAPAMPEGMPPPPTYKEEEFSIEPLDEGPSPATIGATAPPSRKKHEAVPEESIEVAEEVASLSDFEATAEDQGAELSGDEAEMLAMQGSLRGFEEARPGNVGMTIMLVVAAVIVFFAVTMALSFSMGINPFSSLTNLFANQ